MGLIDDSSSTFTYDLLTVCCSHNNYIVNELIAPWLVSRCGKQPVGSSTPSLACARIARFCHRSKDRPRSHMGNGTAMYRPGRGLRVFLDQRERVSFYFK